MEKQFRIRALHICHIRTHTNQKGARAHGQSHVVNDELSRCPRPLIRQAWKSWSVQCFSIVLSQEGSGLP